MQEFRRGEIQQQDSCWGDLGGENFWSEEEKIVSKSVVSYKSKIA